jgi:hypothetical protein
MSLITPVSIRSLMDKLALLRESEEPIDPKLQEIVQDVKSNEVPPTVIAKLVAVLTHLNSVDPAQDDGTEMLAIDEPTDISEPEIEEDTDPATGKWRIGAQDQVLYDLLKQTNPENANKVWAYYNKAMLEEFLIPMLIDKDINKHDDHTRVLNLFINAAGTLDEKIALASRLANGGVIATKKLLTAGSGSIDDLINYKNSVLDEIKKPLISFKVSPSTTAVNTGDGEAFFLILGQGVSKQGAGDLNVKTREEMGKLNVLGREVEVKAQGARLKGFGGKGVYGDGARYYKEFNIELLGIIGPAGGEELAEKTGFSANSPFNFGAANVNALSDVLTRHAKGRAADVRKMFDSALSFIYPQTTPAMRKRVTGTIKSNGSFSPPEFRQGWFLLTYEYYMECSKSHGAGGFDGILFIHQPSFTYKYVKSAAEIIEDWDQFELNPGLYTWTDAPSVAPKITFGKEVRVKTKKPAAKSVSAVNAQTSAKVDKALNPHLSLRPKGAVTPVKKKTISAPRAKR